MAARGRLGANAEITELITELVKQNAKLERMAAKVGTKGDDASFEHALEQQRADTKKLTRTIMEAFKNNKGGDKQVFQKLSNDFQSALKRYEAISQEIEKKERKVIKAAASHKSGSSHLRGSEYERLNGSSSSSGYDEENPSPAYQQQQQQSGDVEADESAIQFLEYDVEELEQRRKGIQAIERDVQEVAEMFRDLATLVNQQQAGIDVIEQNITSAKQQVESAQQNLVEAEDLQIKARKKKCCLVFILLAVLAVIIFLGITFSK